MAETDDIVARLRDAERAQCWYASGRWGPVHNADTRRLFSEAATALTKRDEKIERLTRELAEARSDLETAAKDAEYLLPAKVAAERDLAEARAEVERKDAALAGLVDACDTIQEDGWMVAGPHALREARAALAKGGADGDA